MTYAEVAREICQNVERLCPDARLSTVAAEYQWTLGDRNALLARFVPQGLPPDIRIILSADGSMEETHYVPLTRPSAPIEATNIICEHLNGHPDGR